MQGKTALDYHKSKSEWKEKKEGVENEEKLTV